MERRDRVLRAYFEGYDWDENREYSLKRHLVLHSRELLPDYPLVISNEWETAPHSDHNGKGDLVFADGAGRFAVVEVKWLDLERRGRNRSTRRTTKRKKVRAQVREYTRLLAQRLEQFIQIEGYFFTNEYKQPQLMKKIPE